MQKTLGGDRLGSGKKMKVEMNNYSRSTHNLSYIWRSTMAAGTLVPFMVEVALPKDTFDITLNCDIKTHPTIGPLFGSYKVQLDIFEAPIRLYQGKLHNNLLGIGMKMNEIKLPIYTLQAAPTPGAQIVDNTQVNPSSLLAYLGVMGIGFNGDPTLYKHREFNGIPLLAYWDIYKNYYANKQEEIGVVLHTPILATVATAGPIEIDTVELPQEGFGSIQTPLNNQIIVTYVGTPPIPNQIMINTTIGRYSMEELCDWITDGGANLVGQFDKERWGTLICLSWSYRTNSELSNIKPEIHTFPLSNIDDMRNEILAAVNDPTPFEIDSKNIEPYNLVTGWTASGYSHCLSNQEGLGIKTYQSDLFNNWLKTDWIDGTGGISEITAIDTSAGNFTIDTLLLARKVYDMLNRIMVSGGSYDDWIDAVYEENKYARCESPMYHGGLIKELIFQEVVSNSTSSQETGGEQPLGTLAGKGIMANKHKGGSATIKVSEPGYIIGIISLTPRIDYSQGNKWDVHLKTMDDFHKPALDEIGFQDLITEQMAAWDTWINTTPFTQHSAGKQPAWINYMTNVNRTYGNFAIRDNEMFMTLNRRYEWDAATQRIKDLTTYIDPAKFNQIFAQTSLDSQNFWAQIAIDITKRSLMSARIMPNL